MKRFISFFLVITLSLLLSSCSSPTAVDNSREQTKIINIRSLEQVSITYSSFANLGETNQRQPYEFYYIENPDTINALAVSIKKLTKSSEDPEHIAYRATFYQPAVKPLDMWFSFPDKVWLRAADGKIECWEVEGDFANLMARELEKVPLKFNGIVGLNSVTKAPMLFVFDKPYNLYLAPIDAENAEALLGRSAQVVGKPFIKNNNDYISVLSIDNLPSTTFRGELRLWLTGDLAIRTEAGDYYILRLTKVQKDALKLNIGKNIKVTGVVHEADAKYAKPNIEIYFYKIL